MKADKISVVFDTSVYISAFAIPGSLSEQAFIAAMRGKVRLFTSPAILTETANILRSKFGATEDEAILVLRQINRSAEIIRPDASIDKLADTPDNRILECAVAAGASLVVTGDRHILKLKSYEAIGICRVAEFLHTIGR